MSDTTYKKKFLTYSDALRPLNYILLRQIM